jgi:SAM-dependent methyltransferase
MNVTRGYGLFETVLSDLRAKKADSLIPEALRHGKVVDIGCGVTPNFLLKTQFSLKTGIDSVLRDDIANFEGIELLSQNFFKDPFIALESNSVQAVTMLAVFEHILPAKLPPLIHEIYRILEPGGYFILTVPAGWTDPILKTLARLRLISPDEIFDHKDTYNRGDVKKIIQLSGFSEDLIEIGLFEMGMNIWARAKKS